MSADTASCTPAEKPYASALRNPWEEENSFWRRYSQNMLCPDAASVARFTMAKNQTMTRMSGYLRRRPTTRRICCAAGSRAPPLPSSVARTVSLMAQTTLKYTKPLKRMHARSGRKNW